VWLGYMANLGWPTVAILAACMVVGQICFVAAQYTLAKWSYTSLAEQQKATCADHDLALVYAPLQRL